MSRKNGKRCPEINVKKVGAVTRKDGKKVSRKDVKRCQERSRNYVQEG